jgi:hypothetical protein
MGHRQDNRGGEVTVDDDERKALYALRDELENAEDRRLVRRLLRYVEHLERKLEKLRELLGE